MRTWNRSHLDFDRNSSGAPVRVFVGILAGHLHVAAERQRADAVFGVAALEAEDGRVEAELKLQDPDADALGGEKMPELVHEHEHAEHERERQQCGQCAKHSRTSDLQFYPAGNRFAHAPAPTDRQLAPLPASPLRPARCASIVSLDDVRNCGKRQAALEKQRDRHFVGRVQHDRQARARLERAVRQAEARETPRCPALRTRAGRRAARSSDGSGAVQRSGYENAY